MEDLDVRYAPPQARVGDARLSSSVEGIEPATRLMRLWAKLVDNFIQSGILMVAWGIAGDMQDLLGSAQKTLLQGLVAFALFLVLNGYLLAMHGQTIGKAVFGLRITRRDGSMPSFVRLAGLRYGVMDLATTALMVLHPLLGVVCQLVDVLFIFGNSRRCLHDFIADTVVVRVPANHPDGTSISPRIADTVVVHVPENRME